MTGSGAGITDGVREILLNFIGPQPSAVLAVGCGTARLERSPGSDDRSAALDDRGATLRHAQGRPEPGRGPKAVAERGLVRSLAAALPFRDAAFDRVYCVNTLHTVSDRARFFVEAHRVLRPGGGLLTIGADPHTDRDVWWVYDYFEETRAIDRARFARVRTLRGEMALAGFAWTESMEADHIEVVRPASEVMVNGALDRSVTAQLAGLSEEEFERGAARLREANEAVGGGLPLVTDVRLYAAVAWV